MIKTETIGDRIRTYSDAGMMIKQVETDILYQDAVDIPNHYTYVETDIPIPPEELTDTEALNIIMGREQNE